MSIRVHERSISAVYMLAWRRTNLLCVSQEAALVTQSTDQAYAHHLFNVRMSGAALLATVAVVTRQTHC